MSGGKDKGRRREPFKGNCELKIENLSLAIFEWQPPLPGPLLHKCVEEREEMRLRGAKDG
jgi:hypothetical protein